MVLKLLERVSLEAPTRKKHKKEMHDEQREIRAEQAAL
jgi:hypothetical protein